MHRLTDCFRGSLSGISAGEPSSSPQRDDLDLAAMGKAALNYLRGNPDPARAALLRGDIPEHRRLADTHRAPRRPGRPRERPRRARHGLRVPGHEDRRNVLGRRGHGQLRDRERSVATR